mgnify:CR=1 FL=1
MKLTCVVDNGVQAGSGLWGEHGLSYLIESAGRRVLLDTGQSGDVLMHNLQVLNIGADTIDAVVISHAHYDHTGGLPLLLDHLRPGIPLYANADLFRGRYAQRSGHVQFIGAALNEDALSARLTLRLSADPQEVIPGVWTTGEIRERIEFEGRSSAHLMSGPDGLVPDAYLDDLALILAVGDGLALVCGCCHAGLLNTLMQVECLFTQPVVAVVGGLHLAGVAECDLARACASLAAMPGLRYIYSGHCTGESAHRALVQALGSEIVRPSPAGTVIDLA